MEKRTVSYILAMVLGTLFLASALAVDFYPQGNIDLMDDWSIYNVIDFNCNNCINSSDVNDLDSGDIEGDINTFVDIGGDHMAGPLYITSSTTGISVDAGDSNFQAIGVSGNQYIDGNIYAGKEIVSTTTNQIYRAGVGSGDAGHYFLPNTIAENTVYMQALQNATGASDWGGWQIVFSDALNDDQMFIDMGYGDIHVQAYHQNPSVDGNIFLWGNTQPGRTSGAASAVSKLGLQTNRWPQVWATDINATNIQADDFFTFSALGDANLARVGILGKTYASDFVNLHADPTSPLHAATKAYVDVAASGLEFEYFLTDTTSDIADYNVMVDTDTGEAESTVTSAVLNAGLNQLILNFATQAGQPEFNSLLSSTYDGHFHMAKTGGASKVIKVYWKLFERDSGGVEMEIMQSEESEEVAAKGPVDIHAALGTDERIDDNRMVLKVYANVVGGGETAQVVMYQEGTTDSHVSLKPPTSALDQLYLTRAGSNWMNADLNVGGYDIINATDANFGGDVNIQKTLSVVGDSNFVNLGAVRFHGDGSGLTNLPSGLTQTDANLLYVPYIEANEDVNLGEYGLTANDLNAMNIGLAGSIYGINSLGDANFSNLQADNIFGINSVGDANFDHLEATSFFGGTYYGDGSNLSGVMTQADANYSYVPYVDADTDTNLGVYGLTANDLNVMTLGLAGNVYGIDSLGDANFANIQADNFHLFNALGDANVVNIGIGGTLHSKSPLILTSDDNAALATFFIGEEDSYPGWTIDAEREDTDTTNLTIRTGAEYWMVMGPSSHGGTFQSMTIGPGVADGIIRINASELAPKTSADSIELGTPDRLWGIVNTQDVNVAGDINTTNIQADRFFDLNAQGDANFFNLQADNIFGINSLEDANLVNVGLSGNIFGIDSLVDANFANIQADSFFSFNALGDSNAVNFDFSGNLYGINSLGDANFAQLEATDFYGGTYYGDGSKLTGVLTSATLPKDSTLDTNADAQLWYWTELNLIVPWADANVADDITLTNITQITNRSYSDLSDTPTILKDTTLDTNSVAQTWFRTELNANIPWADVNVADDITLDNLTQITTRNYSDLTGTPTILKDSALDTNTDAQTWFWTELNLLIPWADVNISTYIPSEADIDQNAMLLDTNWSNTWGTFDANMQSYYTLTADINSAFVPYIDGVGDVNLGVYGLTANDINVMHIGAPDFYGGTFHGLGVGLTDMTITADINSAFVPYIDAVTDVNLGTYGVSAFGDLNFGDVGMIGKFFDLDAAGDANFVNIGTSGDIHVGSMMIDYNGTALILGG